MRHKAIRMGLLALLLCYFGDAFASRTVQVGDIRVSFYSNGWRDLQQESRAPKNFMDWTFTDIYKMNVDLGYEYTIRIENMSNRRVAVYVYVDGLNSIERASDRGSAWILDTHEKMDLAGWQLDNEYRSNFVFVKAGAPSGQGGKYPGWIFIAQYRERETYPQPVSPTMRYQAELDVERKTKKKAAGSAAETGSGRVESNPTVETTFDFEKYPTGLCAINYASEVKPKPCSPYLGIRAQSNINNGLYISYVEPGSPAEQAGLERGDVIRYFNGVRTRYAGDLDGALRNCYDGQKVVLEIVNVRDGRIWDVDVTIRCR